MIIIRAVGQNEVYYTTKIHKYPVPICLS